MIFGGFAVYKTRNDIQGIYGIADYTGTDQSKKYGNNAYVCVYKTNRNVDRPIDMFVRWNNDIVTEISVCGESNDRKKKG